MKIRPFTDDDFDAFVTFSEQYLGPSHLTTETFNKHWFRNEQSAAWHALVLEDDSGALIGACMLIVVPAKIGTNKTDMAWISSTAIKDELISIGAGAKFYLHIYRHFPLVGAMSGNEFSISINARMGQDIPGTSMCRYIMMHDLAAARLCLPETAGIVAGQVVLRGDRQKITTQIQSDIPEDYDALWAAFRETVYCTVEKDRAFLHWRYQTAPHLDYQFVPIRRQGRLVALGVVRLQETPAGPAGRILDMICNDTDEAACWSALAAEISDAGAIFSDFHIIGSRYDAALRKSGYQPTTKGSVFSAIPNLLSPVDHREWTNTFHMGGKLAKSDKTWRSAEKIYFTKGDSDRDWPTAYDLRSR